MVGDGLRGKICAPSGHLCICPPLLTLHCQWLVWLFKASHNPRSFCALWEQGHVCSLELLFNLKHEGLLHVAQFSPFVQTHREILIAPQHVWGPACCSLYPGKGLLGAKSPSPLLAPSPCLQVYSSFSLPLPIVWDFSESSFLAILPKGPWENHLYSITSSVSSPTPKCY